MKFYINDLVSFSNLGITPLTMDFLSEKTSITNLENQGALQGKGFRNIPQIYKQLHVIVNKMLKEYDWEDLSKVGLINSYEIANLDASVDFENEIVKYGVKDVNPLKGPLTVSNACAGWLAIKNKLYGLNITVNNGKCSILTSLSIAKNHMQLGHINDCMILSANQNGEIYDQYEASDNRCSEFVNGILISSEKHDTSLVQVISIKNYSFADREEILSRVKPEDGENVFTIIEGKLDDVNWENVYFIDYPSFEKKQFSLFPLFLENIDSLFASAFGKELSVDDIINYVIIDVSGNQSIIKLKKI